MSKCLSLVFISSLLTFSDLNFFPKPLQVSVITNEAISELQFTIMSYLRKWTVLDLCHYPAERFRPFWSVL